VILVVFLALNLSALADLDFLVLGDWGKPIKFADKMAEQAVKSNISFILGIGDNFYQTGVTDLNDKQWQTTFENIYTHPVYHKKWYLIAGNHDYMGNMSAQLKYTHRSARWYLPSPYYTVVKEIGPGQGSIEFVNIDTCLLLGMPSCQVDKVDEAHWKWIEETLKNSKATWTVVMGHHPILSVGHYRTNVALHIRLLPLLTRYKVAAYISGHEHGQQVLHNETSGLTFIVTGNVAKYSLQGRKLNPSRYPKILFYYPSTAFQIAECVVNPQPCYGFTTMKLKPDGLTLWMFDANNKPLYNFTLTNPKAAKKAEELSE